MKLSNKKYRVVYADPAWDYKGYEKPKTKRWGHVSKQYDTLSLDDIKALPVSEICEDDCMLFMWTTFPHMPNALAVIKAWGFTYKTVAFVWTKNDKSTNTTKKYGLGYYTQSNAEIVLLATKGKYWREARNVKQEVRSSIKEHSRKPDEVRNRILKLCGDLPRIELFARIKAHGWDVWGNDTKLLNKPLEAFSDDHR